MVARLGMDHFLLFGQKRPNPTHFPHFTPARPDSGEKNWQSPAKEKIEKLKKNIARIAEAALLNISVLESQVEMSIMF